MIFVQALTWPTGNGLIRTEAERICRIFIELREIGLKCMKLPDMDLLGTIEGCIADIQVCEQPNKPSRFSYVSLLIKFVILILLYINLLVYMYIFSIICVCCCVYDILKNIQIFVFWLNKE